MQRYAEIAALAVIALLVAVGGRSVLANLATHRGLAAGAIIAIIVLAAVGLRRTYAHPDGETRLTITKNVAYLVAAALLLVDLLAPMKWVPGSCIAAFEVALVFDMVTIYGRKPAAVER
jgi:uncharacterized membrane protein